MSSGSEKRVMMAQAALAVGVIVFFVVGTAEASIIKIEITGQITYVFDGAGVLDEQVNTGDLITGWYTYDSETPDSNPLSNVGDYEHSLSAFGVSIRIGGLLFESDPENVDFLVQLFNEDDISDRYLISSSSNLPLTGGIEVGQIVWQLEDNDGGILTSDALIAPVPISADWDNNLLRITCGSGGATRIGATVNDAQIVPEPATVLLLGLGMVAIIRCRK